MRKINKISLYAVFFSPLAFFYEPVKKFLGGGFLFFGCAVAYLIVCSAVANAFGKPR